MNELQREFYNAMNPEYSWVTHCMRHSKYVMGRTPKAKKKHQCCICHRTIQIGERYRLVDTGDGPAPAVSHWISFKLCPECEVRTFNLLRFKPRLL